MTEYQKIKIAEFVKRDNRFIATCMYHGKLLTVHVKNTGRCLELLQPGVKVALDYVPSMKRKTDYDLVAVEKNKRWINIDSQMPNKIVKEALLKQQISFQKMEAPIKIVKPEKNFGDSRFDFYVESEAGESGFIEVKGVTLEEQGYAAFPDAPTLRGLKHVKELTEIVKQKQQHGMLLFIVQMSAVKSVTINEKMQPALQAAILEAQQTGVEIQAYSCMVEPSVITLSKPVPFCLLQNWPVQ